MSHIFCLGARPWRERARCGTGDAAVGRHHVLQGNQWHSGGARRLWRPEVPALEARGPASVGTRPAP